MGDARTRGHGGVDKEDLILATVRDHLREAARNQAAGELVFRFSFNNHGVRKQSIGLRVEYEFLQGMIG